MRKSDSTKASGPVPLHGAAADNLRFIRATMESATAFTGISGKGQVLGGITAAVAAWIGSRQDTVEAWLLVWLLEAALAASIMLMLTAEKARLQGRSLWSGSGQRMLLAFLPTMGVGVAVTAIFHLQGHTGLLPGLWLLLYGAAVLTAGAHSIRLIRVMGLCFIGLGTVQLSGFTPADVMLALGFGGLHIVFGILVWRHHGG